MNHQLWTIDHGPLTEKSIYRHGGVYFGGPGVEAAFKVEQVREAVPVLQIIYRLRTPEPVVADHHYRAVSGDPGDLAGKVPDRDQFSTQIAVGKFVFFPHVYYLQVLLLVEAPLQFSDRDFF
jgi:hypothetical protein